MFKNLRKKILNYGLGILLAMSAGCKSYDVGWYNYHNETKIGNTTEAQPEVFRLPNGVSIRKKFTGGYQNPKISIHISEGKYTRLFHRLFGGTNQISEGNYLVIPQNANWDQIVKGLKVYSDGKTEFIETSEIKKAIESGNEVYPIPIDAYGEDRSGLEKILSEAKKLENEGKLEESLKMQKNVIAQYDSPILQYNIGALNLIRARNDLGEIDLGKIDNIVEDFGKVFSKDPDAETMLKAYTCLGLVYFIKGGLVRTRAEKWFNRAEEEFLKALAINPDYEPAKDRAIIEIIRLYELCLKSIELKRELQGKYPYNELFLKALAINTYNELFLIALATNTYYEPAKNRAIIEKDLAIDPYLFYEHPKSSRTSSSYGGVVGKVGSWAEYP